MLHIKLLQTQIITHFYIVHNVFRSWNRSCSNISHISLGSFSYLVSKTRHSFASSSVTIATKSKSIFLASSYVVGFWGLILTGFIIWIYFLCKILYWFDLFSWLHISSTTCIKRFKFHYELQICICHLTFLDLHLDI